jgi:bacillithiol system protein YtxJ
MKTKLSSIEEFKNIIDVVSDFFIVKHSLTCPISHEAFDEYEKFVQAHPELKAYYLYVQDDRALSNYIAETYLIKHESPQVIRFKEGKAVWHASHWKINYKTLIEEKER